VKAGAEIVGTTYNSISPDGFQRRERRSTLHMALQVNLGVRMHRLHSENLLLKESGWCASVLIHHLLRNEFP